MICPGGASGWSTIEYRHGDLLSDNDLPGVDMTRTRHPARWSSGSWNTGALKREDMPRKPLDDRRAASHPYHQTRSSWERPRGMGAGRPQIQIISSSGEMLLFPICFDDSGIDSYKHFSRMSNLHTKKDLTRLDS